MKQHILTILTVGLLAVVPSIATAQGHRATVVETAPIYLNPETNRTPLRTAAVNTELRLLADEGDWLKVEFNDPQYGRRVGYIAASQVRIDRAELQPMDLSVREPAGIADVPRQSSANSRTAPQLGQPRDYVPPTVTSRASRGWFDVNIGAAQSIAGESSFAFGNVLVQRVSIYGKPPRGAEFDLGGGYMFSPKVGLGLSLSGTAHQDTVLLGAGVIGNLVATGLTDELTRTEAAFNIQAMVVPVNSNNVRVRMFGGPSFFRYEADMVYNFNFSGGRVTSYQLERAEGTGWGAHVGGDVSYFFSRIVGVGAFARYSGATVSVFEPLSEENQDMKLGGFQTGGGLRLRF